VSEGVIMAGDVSERRRREVPSELDDIPRREREVVEDSESQEEVSETREVTTSSEYVDQHMDMVLHEIENRESTEERVSQGMDSALHRLEELNSQPESTEKRLEEALESIEERPVPAEKAFASEGSDDHYQAKLDDFETHEASEVQEQTSRETRYDIDSKEALDKAIQQNQHVKRGFSQETYETCEQYVRVISEDSATSTSEIAEKENLSEQTVENWREGVKPRPIQVIENMEAQRLEHENSVPEEALNHRIDPTQVREITDNHKESEQHTIKELVDVVVDIHNTIEGVQQGGVHYAELYDPQKPLVEDRLRDLALEIRVDREIIQTELNSRLGLDTRSDHEVRIGVTDNRLYYWHISTSHDMWVNVLADQKFYMLKEDKIQLIDEMRQHLHIRRGGQISEYYLNDLINQLSGLENHANNRIQRYGVNHYLDGETLHLIGDSLNKPNEYKRVTTHLGISQRGRVTNLKWPEISEFRAKTYAIIESDGTLSPKGQLRYSEKNDVRRKLAIEEFQEFGDFKFKEYRGPSGKEQVARVELPMIYGSMMKYWGVPEGDKAKQNRGFSDAVINTPIQKRLHYLPEVGAEDGCFSDRRFYIGRSHVIEAGSFYDDLVKFIQNYGTGLKASLHYKTGERIQLRMSKIHELANNEDSDIQRKAKRIEELVSEQPNRLLNDEEKHILQPLGINVTTKPQRLLYSYKTGRVSIEWKTRTRSVNDSMRWALIGPPNHPEKMKAVHDFLKTRDKRMKDVSQQIRADGFEIHPLWND
jgi:hypothetical protein